MSNMQTAGTYQPVPPTRISPSTQTVVPSSQVLQPRPSNVPASVAQSVATSADLALASLKIQEIINRERNGPGGQGSAMDSKFAEWNSKIESAVTAHRQGLHRILGEIKGSLGDNNQAKQEVDKAIDGLSTPSSTSKDTMDYKMEALVKILCPEKSLISPYQTSRPISPAPIIIPPTTAYPIMTKTLTPSSSQTNINPALNKENRFYRLDPNGNKVYIDEARLSTSPTTATSTPQPRMGSIPLSTNTLNYQQASPKVYTIDPITGEKKERPDLSHPSLYRVSQTSPTKPSSTHQSNVQPSPQPTIVPMQPTIQPIPSNRNVSPAPMAQSVYYPSNYIIPQPSQPTQPTPTMNKPVTITPQTQQPIQTTSPAPYTQPFQPISQPYHPSTQQQQPVQQPSKPIQQPQPVQQPTQQIVQNPNQNQPQQPPLQISPKQVTPVQQLPQERSSNQPYQQVMKPVPQPSPPDTSRMISDARKDFSAPIVEYFNTTGPAAKVEVSKDGLQVFYGGDAIGVLEYKHDWLLNCGIIFKNKCCTLKSLPNGDLLVNDFDTWDLVLIDPNHKEKGKLTGTPGPIPQNYKRIRTRNAEDDKYILWLSGPEHLSVVTIDNLTSNEIRFFWNYLGKNCTPIGCAISPSGKKIVGFGELKNQHTLHYYDGSDSVVIYQQDDIHDKCTFWESLEVSFDEDAFFIGGSNGRTTGYILVMAFNEGLEYITEKTFNEARSISALRRHSEGDIYFAGGINSIYVLFYHDCQLHMLSEISHHEQKLPTDIAFSHLSQELFIVFDTDKGIVFYFDENSIKNRDPGKKPEPNVRRSRTLGKPSGSHNSLQQLPPSVKSEKSTTPYNPKELEGLNYQQRNTLKKKPPFYPKHFKEFGVRQINLPYSTFSTSGNLHRVQVTKDQARLIVGKDQLKLLELKNGAYTMVSKTKHIKPTVDFKILKNSNLLVLEKDTSDLVVYSPDFKEIGRIQDGKPFPEGKLILHSYCRCSLDQLP